MDTLRKILRTAAYDFGGIIVFWALWKLVSLKAAIAGTLVFVVFDMWRRRRFGIGFPRLYVLSTSLVIVFGVVDLAAKTPFMLKYEGAVSTFIVAVFFALGARGRSILEELSTQQAGREAVDFDHARRFYQLFTLIWAAYYVLMSGFYLFIGLTHPYARAIVIRQIAGFVGLGVMMLVSLNGRRLYAALRAAGLIPRTPDADKAALRELGGSDTGPEGAAAAGGAALPGGRSGLD